MTKYVPKCQAFDLSVVEARTCLAAMDHNHNLGREQKVDPKTCDKCYRLVFPKASNMWVVKPVYENKIHDWANDMLEAVVECRVSGKLAEGKVVDLPEKERPKNIAPVPAPPKADVIAQHRSRSE